jgi:hypothetical protein
MPSEVSRLCFMVDYQPQQPQPIITNKIKRTKITGNVWPYIMCLLPSKLNYQIQIQPIIANKMNNTRTKVKVLPSPQGVAGWHPQGWFMKLPPLFSRYTMQSL